MRRNLFFPVLSINLQVHLELSYTENSLDLLATIRNMS
jgi:hypothetical protein